MAKPKFRISSFCASGECVAVASLPDGSVQVKHSARESSAPLKFTPAEWQAFIQGVKAGEFDS